MLELGVRDLLVRFLTSVPLYEGVGDQKHQLISLTPELTRKTISQSLYHDARMEGVRLEVTGLRSVVLITLPNCDEYIIHFIDISETLCKKVITCYVL